MSEVTDFDLANKRVLVREGDPFSYDWLIVASGATHGYFGNDHWSKYAPGLKTIEDATEIRKRILFAFEAAEQESDPVRRRAWLTFVIVGGGPTGVEMAGALSDIANYTLLHDFRSIRTSEARILLIEASQYPLDVFPGDLPAKTLQALIKLNVEVRTLTKAVDIQDHFVELESAGKRERIDTETVIWAAGVKASGLAAKLGAATGLAIDRAGRGPVNPDLTLGTIPQVMVIGDMATCMQDDIRLPGLAPVAMQQGKYCAQRIEDQLAGRSTVPFRYHDRGSMAVIGRYRAVAKVGKRNFFGLLAWAMWLVIHIVEITQFRNRLLVLVQWGWTFFSRDRAARLITGETEARALSLDVKEPNSYN